MARRKFWGICLPMVTVLFGCSSGVVGQEEWGDHRPVISPDGKVLAFMSNRVGTWAVYTMPLDGSAPAERVSDDPRGEWYPDWSPDGSQITYYRQDSDGGASFLRTFDFHAGIERGLGPADGRRAGPRWTPDGTRVLYVCQGVGVCAMSSDGRDLGTVYGLEESQHDPALSPDGQWIAFVEPMADDSQEAFIMRIDGSERRRLTTDPGRTYGLDWSPDGRYLSYNTEVDGNADVYLFEPATGKHRRLTTDPGYEHLPRWSPDGTFLIFTSDRSGAERVYRIDLDGGNLAMVATDGSPGS